MGLKQHMLTPYLGYEINKNHLLGHHYIFCISVSAIMWLGLSRLYYILKFFLLQIKHMIYLAGLSASIVVNCTFKVSVFNYIKIHK